MRVGTAAGFLTKPHQLGCHLQPAKGGLYHACRGPPAGSRARVRTSAEPPTSSLMTIVGDVFAGADDESTPLLAGTIHGIRAWQLMVDGDSGRDLLAAIAGDVVWPRRRPMRALCVPDGAVEPGHEVPEPGCSCGIYAHHPFRASSLVVECHDDDHSRVLGVVEAWGRLEVHELGFRAAHARPHTLLVDAQVADSHKHRVQRLATDYGARYVECDGEEEITLHCERLERGLSSGAVASLLADRIVLEVHPDAQGYLTRRGRAIGGHGYYLADQTEPSPWKEELDTEASGTLILRVAGASHRPAALQGPECSPGQDLRLVPEPTNLHDPDAVGIWDAGLRTQLGYVPRARAAEVGRRLAAGEIATVKSIWEWRDLGTGERFGLHILITRSRRIGIGDPRERWESEIPF